MYLCNCVAERVQVCMCVSAYGCVYSWVRVYVSGHVCVCVCMSECMCVQVGVYACVCVHVYVCLSVSL